MTDTLEKIPGVVTRASFRTYATGLTSYSLDLSDKKVNCTYRMIIKN